MFIEIPRFMFKKCDPNKIYNSINVNDTFYNHMPLNYCQLNQEQAQFVNALIYEVEKNCKEQIIKYDDMLTSMEQDINNDN